MPSSTVRRLRDDFAGWAEGRGDTLEIDVVDTLIDLKRVKLGDAHPGRWNEGDLEELLLFYLPRTVTADEAWVATVVPTLRAFLRFAEQTSRMHRSSAPLSRLLATLDEIEPRLPAAMQDTSRFGPAKLVASLMAADGVSVEDPAAVQRWIEAFNERPLEDRVAATGGAADESPEDWAKSPVEGDRFPAMRLPPETELAAAARASGLLETAARLAEWLGDRRQVTATGALRLPDGLKAATELGLEDPAQLAERERWGRLRSSRELRGLERVWVLAVELGLVEVTATRAYPGPNLTTWRRGSDADVLALWRDAFWLVMEQGVEAGLERRYALTQPVIDEALSPLLAELFAVRAGVGWQQVVDDIAAIATEQGFRLDQHFATWLTEDLRSAVLRWRDLGVVAWDGDEITLTPLGRWGVRENLLAGGAEVPLIPDTAALDAAAMLAALGGMAVDDVAVERAAWLHARPPEQAARELVAAAQEATPILRGMAQVLLEEELPAEAVAPAMRAALDGGAMRPYAASWLERHGHAVRVEERDRVWLLVDMAAAYFEALTQDEVLLQDEVLPHDTAATEPADGLLWDAFRQAPLLELCWRCDHPDTARVLEAVGAGHPDRRVAKAARKAAFKARSRGHP